MRRITKLTTTMVAAAIAMSACADHKADEAKSEMAGAASPRAYAEHGGDKRDISRAADVDDVAAEDYAKIVENAFVAVADAPLSTFSIDVDTASYSNVRRFLDDGSLPPADAVRIEEMINYFDYEYAAPTGDDPFAVHTEVGACPWADGHKLVHVGLQGKTIAADDVPPRNLTFLIDVSGSMSSPDKLPLLTQAFKLMVGQLGQEDTVSIVVYAGASGVVLPPTPGSDHATIMNAFERLQAGGSTNGGEGIERAYALARDSFKQGGINRVILATDGDFNVGTTSQGALERLIESERESGVYLSVFGFGTGNLEDSTMEMLADKGNGNYGYIDSLTEARKLLVEQAGATLVTIAKDVKIQVEFNPTEVASYRLVGYENRLMAAEDFNDDTKDAGELGAGHTVTALYEVVPVGAEVVDAKVDPLRYQAGMQVLQAADSGELAHVKLRYKDPEGDGTSKLITRPIADSDRSVAATSEAFRFSAAVAELGMLLRGSEHAGTATFDSAHALAADALGQDEHGHRHELLRLIERAAQLTNAT